VSVVGGWCGSMLHCSAARCGAVRFCNDSRKKQGTRPVDGKSDSVWSTWGIFIFDEKDGFP